MIALLKKKYLCKSYKAIILIFDIVHSLPASRHVIIFDDVVTTGATINELAKTLITADKNTDYVLSGVCLAHGSPR